ncbi:MAG: RraA family protein [Clostridiales bacterium]|nr:RraA family protein [Clostridiales bacterium]
MAIGKRVYMKRKLADPEVVKGFVGIPASNVGDTFERIGCMNPRIRLMSNPRGVSWSGNALTIKTRGGDNMLIHYVLENIAKEGDFLIVSNEGCPTRSIIGQNMACSMETLKLAGIVIDGPIRDIDAIREMTLPVYATGVCPGGPFKDGPGEVNVPLACGDIAVNPGDVIVADPDGICVVPRLDAKYVLEQAKKKFEIDQAGLAAAKNGTNYGKQKWSKALNDKNYEIIDDCYGW